MDYQICWLLVQFWRCSSWGLGTLPKKDGKLVPLVFHASKLRSRRPQASASRTAWQSVTATLVSYARSFLTLLSRTTRLKSRVKPIAEGELCTKLCSASKRNNSTVPLFPSVCLLVWALSSLLRQAGETIPDVKPSFWRTYSPKQLSLIQSFYLDLIRCLV